MIKSYFEKMKSNKYLMVYVIAFVLICASTVIFMVTKDGDASTVKKVDKKIEKKKETNEKSLLESKEEEDDVPPLVTGVVDGKTYDTDVIISFDEGDATLNNSPFSSGSTVKDNGTYELKITDDKNNVTKVTFVINKPTTTQVTQTQTNTGTTSNTSPATGSSPTTPPPATGPKVISYLPPVKNYLYKESMNGEEIAQYSYVYLSTQDDGIHYGTEFGEFVISENAAGLFETFNGEKRHVLKHPMAKGYKWSSAGIEHEITGENLTISVPVGTYTNVISVKYSNGMPTEDFYAPQAGLIMRVITFPDGNKRIMELIQK